MTDFFEIDVLAVETKKSGDAIAIRYTVDGRQYVHVVDGGYTETGEKVVKHISTYYGRGSKIDHVVATHNDGDHACGLREVLEKCNVGKLWLLGPWNYADELIQYFPTRTSVEALRADLREAYSNLAALEEIRRGIEIGEPFQGTRIGAFTVLAPSKPRFLELVTASAKTPDAAHHRGFTSQIRDGMMNAAAAVAYSPIFMRYVPGAWGIEIFSSAPVSAENKMSVVQYANLCGQRILLTGDADESALNEAEAYAPFAGLYLPGIDRFQVSHHGSRRGVSTELFNRWLGPILPGPLPEGERIFTALISSAKEDEDHPRKAIIRAMIHRGGKVYQTEGIDHLSHFNGPPRGWGDANQVPYPFDQEED